MLNYNGLRRHGVIFRKSIETVLNSINKALNKGYRVKIVFADNASSDGSFEFIRIKYYPKYQKTLLLLKFNKNHGFARGNNKAYNYAKMKLGASRYIIFMNPDVIVTSVWLIRLLEVLDSLYGSNIGLAQPLTLPYNIYFKYFEENIYSALEKLVKNKNAIIEDDVINGYCLAIPSNLFEKNGKWDETFFLYGEDIDISLKVLSQGYKNVKVLTSIIFHEAGMPKLSYSIFYEVFSRYLVLARYTKYIFKNIVFFALIDLLRFIYHLVKRDRIKSYSLLSAYRMLIKNIKTFMIQRKIYDKYRRGPSSRIVEHYFNRLTKDLITKFLISRSKQLRNCKSCEFY